MATLARWSARPIHTVDTSVVDARAPRFNQATIGILALVAVTVGPWWLLAVLALQLVVGLTLRPPLVSPVLRVLRARPAAAGRRPARGRAPAPCSRTSSAPSSCRAASVAFAAGSETAGTALGALVAALALLAAATGLCVGCEAYKLGYRLTGRRFVSCPLPPQPAPSSRSL